MELVRTIGLNYGFVASLVFAAIALIVLGLKLKATFLKQIVFSLSAVFVALFLFEGISMIRGDGESLSVVTKSVDYFVPDDFLGYRIMHEGPVKAKKVVTANSTVVYDVTYTLHNGMRVCPNSADSSNSYAIFLGCSFVYGVGVNDNETLPYMFNHFSDNKYNVLNYAVGGYGTHQALATVETKIVNDTSIANSHNSVAIYYFLFDHVRRAAGYSLWDYNGPLYEIVSDSLVYTGPFHKSSSYIQQKLFWMWRKSYLYRNVFDPNRGGASDYDIRRALLMIGKMDELLRKRNLDFVVIFHKSNSPDGLEEYLKEKGIRFFRVEDVIQGFETKSAEYRIENDGHPNALFNKVLGEYLAKNI